MHGASLDEGARRLSTDGGPPAEHNRVAYRRRWSQNRGDSCCTFVDETPGLGLVLGLLPKSYEFSGEELAQFVMPGLYSKRGLKRKPIK